MALIRFFLVGAAGAALRNAIAAAMVLILSLVLVPDPEVMLAHLAGALAGADNWPLRLPFAAIALAVARASQPVFTTGYRGWFRTLGYGGTAHRRAMAVAALLPQAFLVLILIGAVAFVPGPRDGVQVVAAVVMLVGAVAAALPVRRRMIGAGLGLGAVAAGVLGGAAGLVTGTALLVAWDRLAGSIEPAIMDRHWSSGARWIWARLTARALGWQGLAAAVVGVAWVGVAVLFRRNNTLTPEAGAAAVRVLGGIGSVVVAGLFGDRLARARPPWPWSRSLPWSAWTRTWRDAVAGMVLTAPTVAAAAVVDWRSAVLVAPTAVTMAFLAAGQMRRVGNRHLMVSGWMVPAGGGVATMVGLWPVLVPVMAPLVAAAWWDAARTDRRQVATRWEGLHYSATGDSLVTTNR